MIWYPDILFLLVWGFNFFLFHITSRLCRWNVRVGRILISSSFAAGMNVLWMYCYITFHLSSWKSVQVLLNNLIIPLLTLWGALMLAFGTVHVKRLLQKLVLLFIVTLCMGGLVMWLTGTLGIRNSLYLFLGGSAGYGLFLFLQQKILLGIKEEKTLYDVSFSTDKQRVTVKGFYDSGNHLMDPYMGSMVVIVSESLRQRLSGILGKQVLVPYYSLGNEHGMLAAYRCREMVIWRGKEEKSCYHNVLLAVDEQVFSHKQEYDVILHANMEVRSA